MKALHDLNAPPIEGTLLSSYVFTTTATAGYQDEWYRRSRDYYAADRTEVEIRHLKTEMDKLRHELLTIRAMEPPFAIVHPSAEPALRAILEEDKNS